MGTPPPPKPTPRKLTAPRAGGRENKKAPPGVVRCISRRRPETKERKTDSPGRPMQPGASFRTAHLQGVLCLGGCWAGALVFFSAPPKK